MSAAEARLRQIAAGATVSDRAAAEASVRSAQAALAGAEQRLVDLKARPKTEDVRAAELELERSKNALWGQQIARDNTCGRFGGDSNECHAADATVGSYDTAVSGALARLESARKPASAEEVRAADEAVVSARASIASAEARLAMVNGGAVSWDLEAGQSEVNRARAELRSAEARLAEVLGPKRLTVQAAEERLKLAEIGLAQAELALTSSILRAPFAGVVTSVPPRTGEVVPAGTSVVTLARLDDLQLETKDLDEVSAAKVSVGQEVTIVVAALGKKTLRGMVTAIAPQPTLTQSGDVNYTVKVALTEPAPDLRWGMTAKIDFTRGEAK